MHTHDVLHAQTHDVLHAQMHDASRCTTWHLLPGPGGGLPVRTWPGTIQCPGPGVMLFIAIIHGICSHAYARMVNETYMAPARTRMHARGWPRTDITHSGRAGQHITMWMACPRRGITHLGWAGEHIAECPTPSVQCPQHSTARAASRTKTAYTI